MCILRYMPSDLAIGADHRRGVVIQPGRAPLEQRRDDDHLQFARDLAERFGRRSGNRLGQVEQFRVLFAAEILRAEQLLQANDLRAARGGFANLRHRFIQILLSTQRTGGLHQTDSKGLRHRHRIFILTDSRIERL